MDQEYYYYIFNKPWISQERESNRLPMICRIERERSPFFVEFTDNNEAEGPFHSLYELKRRSFILSSIHKQKIRQRIFKSCNIKEIKDFIPNEKGGNIYEKFY